MGTFSRRRVKHLFVILFGELGNMGLLRGPWIGECCGSFYYTLMIDFRNTNVVLYVTKYICLKNDEC